MGQNVGQLYDHIPHSANARNIETQTSIQQHVMETQTYAETRGMETQTHSELRVMETQTHSELRGMETQTHSELKVIETQTSPQNFTDAQFTQTDILHHLSISMQTDNDYSLESKHMVTLLVDTGVQPSPPRAFSPLSWAVQTDVSMFDRHVHESCQTEA